MMGSSERRYRYLFDSIARSHPKTALKLQSVEDQFGVQAAHYAAALIVCLEARVQVLGVQAAGVLSLEDVEKFSYFAYIKDNSRALELLVDVLECHLEECLTANARFTYKEAYNPASLPLSSQPSAQASHH
jgi:hypothetical protein